MWRPVRAAAPVLAWIAVSLLGCDPGPGTTPARTEEPLRIVSLSPEVSELLLSLGVGPRIVAVDAASRQLSGIGDALPLADLEEADVARVAALDPDLTLLLAEPQARSVARRLEASGIHVTLLEPRDANGIDAAVQQIGRLVGRELQARSLAARLARDVARIAGRRDGRSRLRVAFVIRCSPLTVAAGSGLVHESLELAGVENVFHETGVIELGIAARDLRARSPDVVLHVAGAGPARGCFADDAAPLVRAVPVHLARPVGLDLLGRVEALHALLYPDEAEAAGRVPD